uniref:Uncharacterized protein n=1 Tax=Anguilla anguilla TaxID=7936 RepID=A0A0E9XJW7_ANGAN
MKRICNDCYLSFKIPLEKFYFAFKSLVFPIHFNEELHALRSTCTVQVYFQGFTA